uniref:Uncharacterized protein LOC114342627 n=1 Tax=Diabrotica virgifera virgifera TaxID=50390 RepID=A0A6P7GZQ5_DIAVI
TEPQKLSLPITNHDDITKELQVKRGYLFNGLKRVLIVGPSGCGKTNVLLSLIEHPNGLRFENIYLYSKSLYQPKYIYLPNLIEPINEIGYEEYNDSINVPPPDDIKENSVVVFDDIPSCDQKIIQNYYCYGRHKHLDCFYLCQTYSAIPKQLIRDNSNLLVVFHRDFTNLKHIFDDHVNIDMTFQQFKDLCSFCWKDKHGFLVIDKDSPKSNGRYRCGFDKYIRL